MQKKIRVFLFLAVMLFHICAAPAFAGTAPVVTVGNAEGSAGDTVKIPVILSGNTGFANLGIEIGYNPDVMMLKNVTSDSKVGGMFTPAQTYNVRPYNMDWNSTVNLTYNGVLATLTFEIAGSAADGTYPVTVDYYKGRDGNYTDGNDVNYDENYQSLGLQYVNGGVTVKSSAGNSMVVSGDSPLTVKLTGDTNVGIVYAAIYDANGKLEYIKQYPAAEFIQLEYNAEIGAYIKVMWWDGNMNPMCEAQTLSL